MWEGPQNSTEEEERRVARDGKLYALSGFCEFYGVHDGVCIWEERETTAKYASSPSMPATSEAGEHADEIEDAITL